MTLVGANVAVGKQVIAELPILLFSTLRFIIACIALAPLMCLEGGPRISDLSARDWRDLVLQSFFGVFLFTLLMLYGVSLTAASTAGVITGAIPATIAILGWMLLGERPGLRASLGIAVAAAAIVTLNLGGVDRNDAFNGGAATVGMALVGGAVISEALFTIFAKRLSGRIRPMRMAFCVNWIGLILFAPFAVWSGTTLDPTAVSSATWGLAVYYALTASVLSYVLWYLGVRHVPATQAGVFTAVLPLSAVGVSVIFLDEPVSGQLLLGTVFVVLAIWLGTTQERSGRDA